MSVICNKCQDTGWVCEDHPDKIAHECCGGAGMPCGCNDFNPPWHYIPPDKRNSFREQAAVVAADKKATAEA